MEKYMGRNVMSILAALLFALFVNAAPVYSQSCEGLCGGQSPEGCWCDPLCCSWGDCCSDVCMCAALLGPDWAQMCGCAGPAPGGCAGFCGSQSPDGCWCDEACFGFSDCCDDVCDGCPELCVDPPAPSGCEGHCGGQSPDGCWCDEVSLDFADACDDSCEVCFPGHPLCSSPPFGCFGSCGGQAPVGCWCDAACCDFGDCCANKCEACGSDFGNCGFQGEVCVSSVGCAGFCGGLSPDGCWCDEANLIEGFGPVCDDICEACFPTHPFCNGTGNVGCDGFCGGQSPDGCWCDEASLDFADACNDACEICFPGPTLCPSAPAGCDGHCGGESPGGCWCDEACFGFTDCCGDVCEVCCFPSECGIPDLSCSGSCGGQATHPCINNGCWCDEGCFAFMDCCDDVCDACGAMFPQECGPSVGCDGFCGGQSPDGCWCDEACCDFSDCCANKCEACGIEAGNCDASGLCEDLPPPSEGCSLGFWKQPHHFEHWQNYRPGDLFPDVFWVAGEPGSNCCENQCTPSCAEAGNPTGCSDPECEAIICGLDPFCCDFGWDSICANDAANNCDCAAVDALQTDAFMGMTLLEVLTQPSGPPTPEGPRQLNNLGKQAVAALLNASSGMNYALTEEEVKIMFIEAHLAWKGSERPGVLTEVKTIFAQHNTAGCALSHPADLNMDESVDVFDMLIMLSNWGGEGVGDVNDDGIVDIFDLLVLISAWGPV